MDLSPRPFAAWSANGKWFAVGNMEYSTKRAPIHVVVSRDDPQKTIMAKIPDFKNGNLEREAALGISNNGQHLIAIRDNGTTAQIIHYDLRKNGGPLLTPQ